MFDFGTLFFPINQLTMEIQTVAGHCFCVYIWKWDSCFFHKLPFQGEFHFEGFFFFLLA